MHDASDQIGALYITENVTFLTAGAALMSFIVFPLFRWPGEVAQTYQYSLIALSVDK